MNSNWSDSPETLNSAQNQRYLSLVTLKFHGWPWKTIGHLFYATSRFEHRFIAICEFELELQSEKSQFWVKIDIFFSPVTLKYDGSWWRHQMETFSALLALCAGNSPVSGEFPAQRPVAQSFDVFFDLRVNKRLTKQSWGWWFGTLSRSLWRHRNDNLEKQ